MITNPQETNEFLNKSNSTKDKLLQRLVSLKDELEQKFASATSYKDQLDGEIIDGVYNVKDEWDVISGIYQKACDLVEALQSEDETLGSQSQVRYDRLIEALTESQKNVAGAQDRFKSFEHVYDSFNAQLGGSLMILQIVNQQIEIFESFVSKYTQEVTDKDA